MLNKNQNHRYRITLAPEIEEMLDTLMQRERRKAAEISSCIEMCIKDKYNRIPIKEREQRPC